MAIVIVRVIIREFENTDGTDDLDDLDGIR